MVYVKRSNEINKSNETLIGISVSKKHGKAVVRNRIKRLIRAVYYPLLPSIKKGYMIVFVPKVTENYSFENFSRDIRYLLNKESMLGDVE